MLSKWGQRFSPLSLFAAGEQGGWWDPSDFSTMFQDSAGTTPVTTVGQPVGLIRDKSGRGNHLLQGTAASRPTLQQDASGFFLLFDGVDDTLSVAGNLDLSATDKVLVVVGMRKLSDAARGCITKLNSPTGFFRMESPGSAAAANFTFNTGGSLTSTLTTPGTFAAPLSAVATGIADIANDVNRFRVNTVEQSSALDQGTGNFSSAPLNVGADGGTVNFFNGRLYSLIVRGTLSSAAQVAQAERYVGSTMGIAL